MSTAVAAAPAATTTTTPLAPLSSPHRPPSYTSLPSAAPSAEPAAKRQRNNASPLGASENNASVERSGSHGKSSPTSGRNIVPPKIQVKKEPLDASPSMSSSRPRPKRLDLSTSMANSRGPNTARGSGPLTSRESAGLHVQDVGLACLSPGFQTHDPAMREQLQRSLDVRDQQRQIIEARQKGTKPGSSHENDSAQRSQDTTLFGVQTRTPTTSRRKGPPPGLSIAAPSAQEFANDRVIQSAPLHQTFTGLRPGDQPYSRQLQHGPSGLSQTSHIHHVPATQTNNRLPPIADVFANDRLDAPRGIPPVPSPSFPPQHQNPPLSARAREFRSAEEAVAGLSGGREDLMPKVVHYGGVQPPTPPSPMPPGSAAHQHSVAGTQQPCPHAGSGHYPHDGRPDILARTSSMNGRRRGRDEYERDNGSPPSGSGYRAQEAKRTAFAVRGEEGRGDEEDWRRGMGGREKREEFLRLCERAWDLFHS
ncbi:uncharacterized protein LTR77_002876 [Saxophila tyrrhenica]|uniref:Uncharacterized protein n=1 Tax=Saxophila tyrrhenica TaxID=1690608 RepID=A0AAV9PGQ5_9PEZI|nr:hypothetical protein LTR77_002876 [Saxophila tyrrhenica]